MNPKTKPASPASHAPLSSKDQTQGAGFMGDLQDLFSLGMDRAIGIEKASIAEVVRLNSDAIDSSMNALWFSPALGDLFNTAAKAFASCMELQLNWLALLVPHSSSRVASRSGTKTQPTAEVSELGMDIAIGARFTASSSMVESGSATQAQPTAEVPESSMEIAIGAGAA